MTNKSRVYLELATLKQHCRKSCHFKVIVSYVTKSWLQVIILLATRRRLMAFYQRRMSSNIDKNYGKIAKNQ
jgi:hypothetical protein